MATTRSADGSGGSLLHRLGAADRALFDRVATRSSPHLDRVLPRLTHSADHGLLWLGLAALLAASGQRRAALRGVLSLGAASFVANVPAKLAVRRQRPERTFVPALRQLRRQPSSSSFPSGHSASAAAFATGVALEAPVLGLPVGLLAAGVAHGRVHTGVHYPGDVAVGLALGVGSAMLVRRLWPVRHEGPSGASGSTVAAPALPHGEGLVVVINTHAGSGDTADMVAAELRTALPEVEVVRCHEGDDIEKVLSDAASRAVALGVMGGDGTVNCAAGIALERGLPLAVLPGGTLNHFAKDLGVQSVEQTIEAVRRGCAVSVCVGSSAPEGDGQYFLNTLALGVYPEIVSRRERRQEVIGKWPAMAVAAAAVAREAQPVQLLVDGRPRRLWTLFVGNGRYRPDGFAPSWRDRLDESTMDVRLISAEHAMARVRLCLALLAGQLKHARAYEQLVVDELDIRSADGSSLDIARDGEAANGPAHLTVRSAANRLRVYVSVPSP